MNIDKCSECFVWLEEDSNPRRILCGLDCDVDIGPELYFCVNCCPKRSTSIEELYEIHEKSYHESIDIV